MWVGIDTSLTATGLCLLHEDATGRTRRVFSQGRQTDTHADTMRRLDRIEREIRDFFEGVDGVLLGIAMEGPSLSPRRMGQDHERAGLWWRVFTRASRYADVLVVSPKTRAKYATGNGNSGKDEVLLAVSRRYPGVDMVSNDEADAVAIAAILARVQGAPVDDPMPKTHLAALVKLGVPLDAD